MNPNPQKISLGCDGGKNGALVATDDDRRILFTQKFVDGVPPNDFNIRYTPGPSYSHRFVLIDGKTVNLRYFESDAEILCTLEIHNWRHASMKRAGIKPNHAAKHEFYTGRIYQWLVERGFGGLIQEVQAREWQKLVHGTPGETPKERAAWWVMNEYCPRPEGKMGFEVLCGDCDCSKEDCPLKQHGIIGPKRYDKDLGDALGIANWRLDQERIGGENG